MYACIDPFTNQYMKTIGAEIDACIHSQKVVTIGE
jgi:hypothetical protein